VWGGGGVGGGAGGAGGGALPLLPIVQATHRDVPQGLEAPMRHAQAS